MIITNTSRYPDEVISKLIRYAARQLEIEDYVDRVQVTNTSGSYRGRCWGHGVLIRIGAPEKFPRHNLSYPGLKRAPKYDLADWIEAIVHIAAHEFQHSRQFKAKAKRHSEIEADRVAIHVLNEFRKVRPSMEAELTGLVQRRAIREATRETLRLARVQKAQSPEVKLDTLKAKIVAWERKRKLAETYLKKYRRALRRQEKRLAEPEPAVARAA